MDWCLFQFHRTAACWASAEGGWREEESRSPAGAEEQGEGARQGGDGQRQTLQQRLLPRTGQEASTTGPRELEGRNPQVLSQACVWRRWRRLWWRGCADKASEKVRGWVQLGFWPCRVLVIITWARQMAAWRGLRENTPTWSHCYFLPLHNK